MLNYHSDEMDEGASPEKFLGYIKEASCVVTTSFHGTAFSILFQTPFYVVKQGTVADNRMCSLLHTLSMDDRILQMMDRPTFSIPTFEAIQNKLKKINTRSKSFISSALEK